MVLKKCSIEDQSSAEGEKRKKPELRRWWVGREEGVTGVGCVSAEGCEMGV